MPVQRHAVIVHPQQWAGPPAKLARLLSPFTGADVTALTAALDRGPMTVEADLHVAEAESLTRRLTQLGIPATIDPPPSLDEPSEPPVFNAPRERITAEVPRKRSSTVVGHKTMPPARVEPADSSDDGGWGALFPDLAPEEPRATYPPSLDDLEGAAPSIPAPARRRLSTPPLTFERDDFDRANLTVDDIEVVLPATPRRAPAPPTPTPTPTPAPAPRPALPSRKLDHAKLEAMLPDDDNAPPYQPRGYDPRPEHHPPFAAAFAVLAPGAGHVFNGDDDAAMRTLTGAWKIAPWVRSVRQSRANAEKIRTYWAPRPADGSGARAFRWAALFWVCVVLATMLAVTLVPLVMEMTQRRTPQDDPTARVASVVQSASTTALAARVAALDAVAEASREIVSDHRYTMSEEERAQRLFALGVPECTRRNYAMCAAMMRRVLELKPGFTPAIRLQAWASVSMNGRKEPMPDVGDVPALSKLELSKLRQEMALEGEEVPAPPKDDAEEVFGDREEVVE